MSYKPLSVAEKENLFITLEIQTTQFLYVLYEIVFLMTHMMMWIANAIFRYSFPFRWSDHIQNIFLLEQSLVSSSAWFAIDRWRGAYYNS